jgi:hypothetical protein
MNYKIAAITLILFSVTGLAYSQTTLKDYTVGHQFHISIPNYMNRTIGLNNAAIFQFKNSVKDIAGFIIEDDKEELRLADLNYSSINEFYDDFIKDFLKDEEKRNISKPLSQTKDGINFIECDATYFDKDAEFEIYYFVGIAETKTTYYKFLCYGAAESKDKFKSDFQKALYSIKD